MAAMRMIHIPLPENLQASESDLDMLRATFQAVVSLRCDRRVEWQTVLRQMEADGWTVRWGLNWVADAKRGDCHESVSGVSVDDAIAQLYQMTRLHAVEGCP